MAGVFNAIAAQIDAARAELKSTFPRMKREQKAALARVRAAPNPTMAPSSMPINGLIFNNDPTRCCA